MGDEGLESDDENAVKTRAKLDGLVSVVASVVAIRRIPTDVLAGLPEKVQRALMDKE